ncbi:MAG: hypothetical protein D6714_05255 [Bacteroidetes bacterium]|nr:MAG: hypothetical protein D6714_05255 [Bacteroidota bacterium]
MPYGGKLEVLWIAAAQNGGEVTIFDLLPQNVAPPSTMATRTKRTILLSPILTPNRHFHRNLLFFDAGKINWAEKIIAPKLCRAWWFGFFGEK